MKSREWLLSVGTSFVASAVLLLGCPVAEKGEYPNREARKPGGGVLGTGGAGGQGGVGGIGGSGNGGPVCGDGVVEGTEACDNGETDAGSDGCSAACEVEACWVCPASGCTPAAAGEACDEGMGVCDGKGACAACVPPEMACDGCKNCDGSSCDGAEDCVSGACVTGVCRAAMETTCADAVECVTNYCRPATKACEACTTNLQCASGACVEGRCRAAAGEPCDDTLPCGDGAACVESLCKAELDGKCTSNHQCMSNLCKDGACVACAIGADCGGAQCTAGSCPQVTVPDGAYCNENSDCSSNNCTGFPRRCQPPP